MGNQSAHKSSTETLYYLIIVYQYIFPDSDLFKLLT